MFKYAAMITGVIIMCVPEDVSALRFFFQAGFGLALFGLGVLVALEESR